MQGYVQVYTGDGKGKTTAALGLALRAAGAGLRVYIGQFIKNAPYHELNMLSQLQNIVVVQYGRGCFLIKEPEVADQEAAQQGLTQLFQVLAEKKYDLVIADEILVAHVCGLITEQDICEVIDARPRQIELVLTGRGATEAVLERADLVTEMRCVRHYYDQGVLSRKGIDN